MNRLRPISVLVLAALLAAACTPTKDTSQKVRTDHATAKAAPPTLGDTGPPTQALKPTGLSVQTKTPKGPLLGAGNVHTLVGGQILTVATNGLEAYDAVTGKPRWHYKEPGRFLRGFAATGNAVVALTRPDTLPTISDRWVGLDAATGRILWTSGDKGLPLSGLNRLLAGSGVIPVRPRLGAKGITAIDTRTGRTRWSQWDLGGATCKNENPEPLVQGDGSLFFITMLCQGSQPQLVALDPTTGKERWRQPPSASITVQRGTTLLSGNGDPRLISPSGRLLSTGPQSARCTTTCLFTATDEHAAIAYDLPDDDHRLLVIDTRTGKSTDIPRRGPYQALSAAGDTFYALRETLADPLLSSGIDLIPANNPKTVRTLATGKLNHHTGIEHLQLAGGHAYITKSSQDTWSTQSLAPAGPTPGPAELAGVPASDWPDACSLTPGFRKLQYLANAVQDARIGPVHLRRVTCALREQQDNRDVVTVTIAWVAPTPQVAGPLIPPLKSQPISNLGDEAYTLDDSTLLMRVGRYIITLDSSDNPAKRAAKEVAQSLTRRN